MTTQLLATELANLVQESKRKNNDLRQAAEKSLEELKSLNNNGDSNNLEELATRLTFVNPFIIACGTKNAKFTEIAIVCLQRLTVSRGLPRSRLSQVLEALMQAATSGGLDVQLKILQLLPSLLTNYGEELRGGLLVTALNLCCVLQGSRNAIVEHTAAATLQQALVTVFEKVVEEDRSGDVAVAGEAPTKDGNVQVKPAALDAYRVFNDLCLLTENQRPEYLRSGSLPQTFGLELIESAITNHATVFKTHPEQVEILRSRVMPLLISALKGKSTFATTVRLVRVLYTLLRRHINILPDECGEALEVMTQLLDSDTSIWKRSLCMEVFRGVFAEYGLLRRIYAMYDGSEGGKNVIRTLTATFVRLSTEKPQIIGLGNHSTLPIITQDTSHSSSDQALLEATSMTGVVGASAGSETLTTGISTQWSSVRVPCIDQLDKTEPPAIPESYVHSLVLSCISSLSDGMAKFILPLTVPNEAKSRKRSSKGESAPEVEGEKRATVDRTVSFKKNPMPVNPLELDDHPMHAEVRVCSSLIEECWPAILATCSTFLYSALDSEYYHALVRAFQRFAHVAGLLGLSTPRDAFLTTLGKSAVPPNVLTACLNAGQARSVAASAEATSAGGGSLKVTKSSENLTPTSPTFDTGRKGSVAQIEAIAMSLNTRNLLCLRALLNLGIALGPTLDSAWKIILDTLQQADYVLYTSGKAKSRSSSSATRDQDAAAEGEGNSLMAGFANETRSVETAAARLLESTIDFPNEAFIGVVQSICDLLAQKSLPEQMAAPTGDEGKLQPAGHHKRAVSFSLQSAGRSPQQDQFALAKLGDVASINLERLLMFSAEESGWDILLRQFTQVLETTAMGASVRIRAAETMVKLALEAANISVSMPEGTRADIQIQVLDMLHTALVPLNDGTHGSIADQSTDVDIHKILLDGLKSIMDDCGESLVAGWETAFEIIASIFVIEKNQTEDSKRQPSIADATALSTKSPRLIRSAFSSLQLICTDFLTSLPRSCFLLLVDTVYKFCSQADDLNIALTTVTFFWVLSDFLSGKTGSLDITAELMQGTDIAELEASAADAEAEGSDSALWMLLLLRLTTVASDDRLELRNSAIQTLLRIFDAYGERLNPEAWVISVKFVIFKLLTSLEEELKAVYDGKEEEHDRTEWNGTAVVILDGTASLLADYLDVLISHPAFSHLWKEFLGHLATLLDFSTLEISTAALKALGHILSRYDEEAKTETKTSTVEAAWGLWSRDVPVTPSQKGEGGDNQACLTAYVTAMKEIYRLCEADIDLDRVRRMLSLLQSTTEAATVGPYATDIEQPTPLQSQVLQSVTMIRTDIEGAPSAIISQLARFTALPFNSPRPNVNNPKRTFVAFSKGSMKLLQQTIITHAKDDDIYKSGSFATALMSLNGPIALKYAFDVPTKSTSPWGSATETSLAILNAALPHLKALREGAEVQEEAWTLIADAAGDILFADCNQARAIQKLDEDEEFDIASFQNLLKLIIPDLGAEQVPDSACETFSSSLFKNSIIHEMASGDQNALNDGIQAALTNLKKPRSGRTVTIAPTKRSRMAYVAFDALFGLSCVSLDDSKSPDRIRLAKIIAPFLVVRCALTLRSFVADQPLRGKMPTPLSQRKELMWMLQKLVGLGAYSGDGEKNFKGLGGSEDEAKKYLLVLYPLLVGALRVNGEEKVGGLVREAMEAVGGELGL